MFWLMFLFTTMNLFTNLLSLQVLICVLIFLCLNKVFGRVIFILLFLELFTLFFLIFIFSLLNLGSMSFSSLYLFLASAALEISLGFGLVISLVRMQTNLETIL